MRMATERRQLDNNNGTTTIYINEAAMTAMAEMEKVIMMAMAMATATETATLMMPPPSMVKMSMKTTTAIQGWQLDVNDGTTLM